VALTDELAWQADAACVGEPLRHFFPARGEMSTRALVICAGCPVRIPCLTYALTHGHGPEAATGIWGGTSERERRKIPKRCAACQARLPAGLRARHQVALTPAHLWLCESCAEIARNTRRPDGPAAVQRARQGHERWGSVSWVS
jgi:WhiB family redox-sensing transcriptional regulator